MSKRMIVLTVCDACYRDDEDGGITIGRMVADRQGAIFDICTECLADGVAMCRYCDRPHNAANPCEYTVPVSCAICGNERRAYTMMVCESCEYIVCRACWRGAGQCANCGETIDDCL